MRASMVSFQKRAERVLAEVLDKTSTLTITELKEFLFRCAAALVYGKQVCVFSTDTGNGLMRFYRQTMTCFITSLHYHSQCSAH